MTRTGIYGLIEKEGKLLAIRQKTGPHAGRYDLPGGRIEPGEGLEEALRRELLEEVGMTFETMSWACNLTALTGDFHQIGLVYRLDGLLTVGKGELESYWIDPSIEELVSPFIQDLYGKNLSRK